MTGLVMNVDVANHDMGRQDTTYYYQMATDRRQPKTAADAAKAAAVAAS